MNKRRTAASYQVTAEIIRLGLPADFAELVGGELNTDFTACWMLRYLQNEAPKTMEAIADEMLGILEFRDAYIKRQIGK